MQLLTPLDGGKCAFQSPTRSAHIGTLTVFSTKRAGPNCGTSCPKLDSRMFSCNRGPELGHTGLAEDLEDSPVAWVCCRRS